MTPLSFELLKVGHCQQIARMACRKDRWRMCEFPALVALIRHPEHGTILFDTGYAPRLFDVARHWPERFYTLAVPVTLPGDQHLLDQLKRRRLSAADIDILVLSHFHADHIAGVRDFPGVPIVCSREGLTSIRTARRLAGLRQALLPALLPDDVETRATYFEYCPLVPLPAALAPFSAGYDVLGDGSLLAVALPGHAAGQYGVVFQREGGGLVFLVADAAWSTAALREDALPMALACHLLGHSAAYPDTFHRLHAIAARESDESVLLVPSHCARRARDLVR